MLSDLEVMKLLCNLVTNEFATVTYAEAINKVKDCPKFEFDKISGHINPLKELYPDCLTSD